MNNRLVIISIMLIYDSYLQSKRYIIHNISDKQIMFCLVLKSSDYKSGRNCPIEKKYSPVNNDDHKYI